MNDAARAAETLLRAAELNRDDPLLSGSLLEFPDYGQVVMTGDLHGHRRNFERLKRFCALEHYRPRHVILHEIIHEEVEGLSGRDRSYEVLLEAAQWKCDYPDQVHFLQSNHELAQLTRHEITKNGRVVTMAFEDGLAEAFGSGAEQVVEAINEYIRSLPLAGRTPNRVFLSHSLPSPRDLNAFDPSVLARATNELDLRDGGSAHALVWGRYHTEAALVRLCDVLDAEFFVCGHQPQETGFEVLHQRMIILASDHNHGAFMTLDLSRPVTLEGMLRNIRPLAAIE
jgi:hypothetical protein